MRVKFFALYLILGVSFYYTPTLGWFSQEHCDSVPAQSDVPEEIEMLAKGIIIFDRHNQIYRTLEIGDSPSVMIATPQAYRDLLIVQTPLLSSNGSQILNVYRNAAKQTFVVVNSIEVEAVAREIIIDDLVGYRNFLTWLNTDTILATSIDEEDQVYRYKKISATTGSIETVEIRIDDLLSTPAQASISSDESRLAYVRYSNSNAQSLVDELMIRDNRVGIVVKSLSASDIDRIYGISWSPLGNYVLVTITKGASSELQVLDNDAQPIANIPVQQNLGVQWSPDERFVLYYDSSSENKVYPFLWNIQLAQTIDLCMTSEGFWSPDGRYLGIVQHSPFEEGTLKQISDIFVYDTLQAKMYNLEVANLEAVGSILGWGCYPDKQHPCPE